MDWIIYSLIAMICFSLMYLLFKYLTTQGLTSPVILVFLFGFVFIFYLLHILLTKTPIKVNTTIVVILILASLLSYLGNLFNVKSIGIAPNPGYAVAITSLQIVIITLASVVLFSSKLTLVKVIGILFAILAVVLLAL